LSSLKPSHAERLITRLERDAFPALAAKLLKQITSADVLTMVRSVEAPGALDISRRLEPHVSQIYRFAISQGWADQDPAAYITDLLKPKPRGATHGARRRTRTGGLAWAACAQASTLELSRKPIAVTQRRRPRWSSSRTIAPTTLFLSEARRIVGAQDNIR
jgi:hypothetical protein